MAMMGPVDGDLLDQYVEVVVSRYPTNNTGFFRHTGCEPGRLFLLIYFSSGVSC